jgi:uroporphyrinogen-III synthase
MTKVKSILISQPKPDSPKSPYFSLAKKYKVDIEFQQFIKVEPVIARDFRKSRISINEYSAIILTSRNSIDHLFRLCDELRIKLSQETKYFCITEAIALYLQKYIQYRKRKVFYGNGTVKELKELLLKHKENERFLLPGSNIRTKKLPSFLEENGFNYQEAMFYKTVSADLKDLDLSKYDMIVFFSPQGLNSLQENFPDFKQGDTLIAGFGPATCKSIEEAGLKLEIKAPSPEARSMATALERFMESVK